METVKLSGPVVSIENMDLMRHVDAKGIGETQAYWFTHEVLWVREVIPMVSFWHGVQKVKDAGTYLDVGGFLNGVTAAVEAAETCCAYYDMKMDSSMRVLVSAKVRDIAVLRQKNGEKREVWFGLYEYPTVPADWLSHPSKTPLSDSRLIFNTIIWTSIVPEACNTLVVKKFKERWNMPSLIEQR